MNKAIPVKSNCGCTAKQARQEAAELCFHCNQPVQRYCDIHTEINGQRRAFCRPECKQTALYIEQQALAGFYSRREKSDQSAQANSAFTDPIDPEQWSALDDPLVAADYVQNLQDGVRELRLELPTLYCASCSWLIDKTMQNISPAIQSYVDATAKQLSLRIADPDVSIGQIIDTLARLGYPSHPINWRGPQSDVTAQAIGERHAALKRIAVAGFGMMQVMTYAFALYFGDFYGMEETYHRFLILISMLVATVVVFYSGSPFFSNAWNDLRHRRVGMDVPIALAIAGAYFPSVYQTLFRTEGHVYFDSAVMFIFFLSVARYIETRARHRLTANPAVLSQLLPLRINVDRTATDCTEKLCIAPQAVEPGDMLSLEARQTIPFDGNVVKGSALIDESFISGESTPVRRMAGGPVLAGSRVVEGSIVAIATTRWVDSSISKIEQLLQTASAARQRQSDLLQGMAHHFVAAVLLIIVVTALVWLALDSSRVFQIVLAMLVASCPCAFSLAAPIGATAASHALRVKGLILTNFDVLKVLPEVNTWCFDKTGTITRGAPTISDVTVFADVALQKCLSIASALEQHSDHVLAHAFRNVESNLDVLDIHQYAGRGISGCIEGRPYYLGNAGWLLEQQSSWSQSAIEALTSFIDDRDNTVVVLGTADQCLACFLIKDELRPESAQAINSLRARGHDIAVLSGDRQAAVNRTINGFQINQSLGDLLPEQKMEWVRARQAQGSIVAMVGDGINDAPVIAQADVSIAMTSGSTLSQSQADVLVMNGRLSSLTLLQDIAGSMRKITRQNLTWAIAYNVVALPLAASGMLLPWIAALGMSLSSLLVVLNALRIAKPLT